MSKAKTRARRIVNYNGERVVVLERDKRLSESLQVFFASAGFTVVMLAFFIGVTTCQFSHF